MTGKTASDKINGELEDKFGGPSARTVRRQKAKQAPKGQTKSGLASRVKTNKGFKRSGRQPDIKIVDKTKATRP